MNITLIILLVAALYAFVYLFFKTFKKFTKVSECTVKVRATKRGYIQKEKYSRKGRKFLLKISYFFGGKEYFTYVKDENLNISKAFDKTGEHDIYINPERPMCAILFKTKTQIKNVLLLILLFCLSIADVLYITTSVIRLCR